MNKTTQERWHIVGHGAIGLLWAKNMNVTHHVEVILRNPPIQTKAQYTFIDINQKHHAMCLNTSCLDNTCLDNTCFDNTCFDTSAHNNKIENLLIPVKAYDVIPALIQLRPFLTETCTIILCHNGMGTIEPVQALLKPQQNLYFATTTHGAYKPDQHTVKHTGLGETKIGLIKGKHILSTNKHLLAPVTWQQDINLTLWSKLAINCAINPLTVIHNCKNGQLAKTQYRQTLTQICQEFSQVANKALDAELFKTEQLLNQCLAVIKSTAENYSSMYQDIKHQRKSEIDFITGYIINKANELNLSVPTHQLIYRQFNDIATQHQ